MTLPRDVVERPARPEDADGVLALIAACDESYLDWAPAGWRAPEVPPDWRARLAEPWRWTRLAVEPGGRVVGMASWRPAEVPGVAHLGGLFTHPARWREGIAAHLLAAAEAAMAAGGLARARLWTPRGAPAERFYRARGWAPDGRSEFHAWLGLEMVGYGKALDREAAA